MFLVGIMLAVIAVLLTAQLRREAMIRKLEGSIISFLLEIVGGHDQAPDRRGREPRLSAAGPHAMPTSLA